VKISIIENYLDQSELNLYFNFCKTTNAWIKTKDSWSNRIIYANEIQQFDEINTSFLSKVKAEIASNFNLEREIYPDYLGLVRWLVGNMQNPHADGESPNEQHPYYWRDFGCVYYLNDNYNGGEIYFPNQELEIKPKPNTLIFFPGTLEYLHGVKPITNGIRYTLTSFWTHNKQFKMNYGYDPSK
jgi:hypothetical protein